MQSTRPLGFPVTSPAGGSRVHPVPLRVLRHLVRGKRLCSKPRLAHLRDVPSSLVQHLRKHAKRQIMCRPALMASVTLFVSAQPPTSQVPEVVERDAQTIWPSEQQTESACHPVR